MAISDLYTDQRNLDPRQVIDPRTSFVGTRRNDVAPEMPAIPTTPPPTTPTPQTGFGTPTTPGATGNATERDRFLAAQYMGYNNPTSQALFNEYGGRANERRNYYAAGGGGYDYNASADAYKKAYGTWDPVSRKMVGGAAWGGGPSPSPTGGGGSAIPPPTTPPPTTPPPTTPPPHGDPAPGNAPIYGNPAARYSSGLGSLEQIGAHNVAGSQQNLSNAFPNQGQQYQTGISSSSTYNGQMDSGGALGNAYKWNKGNMYQPSAGWSGAGS